MRHPGSLIGWSRELFVSRHEVRLFLAQPGELRDAKRPGPEAWAYGTDATPVASAADGPEDARAIDDFAVNAAGPVARTPRAILIDGEIAGWGFTSCIDGPFPVLEAHGAPVPATRGDVVLSAFHVRVRYRGRGLYQAMLAEMAGTAFRAGAARVWIYARAENLASCSAILRVGFRPVGRWIASRLLGRRTLAWRDAAQSASETSTRLS